MPLTETDIHSWLTGAPLTATAQAALTTALFPTAKNNNPDPIRLLLFCDPGHSDQGAAQAAVAVWEAAYPARGAFSQTLWAGVLHLDESETAVVFMAENSGLSVKEAALLTRETLQAEYFLSVVCGISAPFAALPFGEKAFTEAQECLALASEQATVQLWEETALPRLLQALPLSACDEFCREFGRGMAVAVDHELLRTAECFVAHDLSVPKTAAALFCHRNTLLYRLTRFEELTGLDLRRAQNAAEFSVWLAVRRRVSI